MKKFFALSLSVALLLSLLCACGPGGGQEKQVNLADFARNVLENHEFPMLDRLDPTDAEFGAVMLEDAYPGLKDLDLAQTEVYSAIISFSGGELALVQAKNAGDAARVREIFDARVTAKTTEGPNSYSAEVELWQHNTVIVSRGNYVMLVSNEDSAAIVNEFNALFE